MRLMISCKLSSQIDRKRYFTLLLLRLVQDALHLFSWALLQSIGQGKDTISDAEALHSRRSDKAAFSSPSKKEACARQPCQCVLPLRNSPLSYLLSSFYILRRTHLYLRNPNAQGAELQSTSLKPSRALPSSRELSRAPLQKRTISAPFLSKRLLPICMP